MALDSAATLVIGAGNFYRAPVGTALPADLSVAPITPWVNIGHTSLSDIFGWNADGGDETILGTLQAPTLRVKRSASTESFTINLQQWDEASLKLFFGSNATTVGDWMRLPQAPAPTSEAFLAIFKDVNGTFAIHAPQADWMRGDVPTLSDTESLATLPLKITPVVKDGNDFAIELTPMNLV